MLNQSSSLIPGFVITDANGKQIEFALTEKRADSIIAAAWNKGVVLYKKKD